MAVTGAPAWVRPIASLARASDRRPLTAALAEEESKPHLGQICGRALDHWTRRQPRRQAESRLFAWPQVEEVAATILSLAAPTTLLRRRRGGRFYGGLEIDQR